MITQDEFNARKNRMIMSAYTLFCQKGIASSSMQEIARAAKVSEISLYRYFGGKLKLLIETQKILWDNILEQITTSVYNIPGYHDLSGLEQIKLHINGFNSLMENHSEYLLFSAELKTTFQKSSHILQSKDLISLIYNPVLNLKTAIEKGQKDGSIKNKFDAFTAAETIWVMLRSFTEHIVIFDKITSKNSYRESFDQLIVMVISYLSNE